MILTKQNTSPRQQAMGGRIHLVALLAVCVLVLPIILAVQAANPEEPCIENGPYYGAWTLNYCPSQTNSSSVSPAELCGEIGQAPTVPTVVPPVYQDGQKQRAITYDCPTTNAAVEYSGISYSVGGVQWDPPLPGALTNSFSSTAYVIVTSGDTNLCASPGRVDIGSATWTVSCNFSHYTTNCTPGSLTLTNATGTTNVCLGDGVSASVSQVVSNALLVVTSNYTNACGNVDTNNCPPTHVTNSLALTVLSNWWTASVGSYTNSGTGLSASFTPTNGGSGSVTFNTAYVNQTPCSTNTQTATATFSFNVSTNCLLSLKTTNCQVEGVILFTNITANPTNSCVGTAMSASATREISNAVQVVTSSYTNACGAVTTNCPDTKVTNSVAPVTVTNWWTVSVGAFSTNGSGLSASFTPTNSGNGTVTFYSQYSNMPPCSATSTISTQAAFTVIAVASLSPNGGILVTGAVPPTYKVCPGTNDIIVTAVPTPSVAETNLPSCWTFTGGTAVGLGKLQRKVNAATPGTNVFVVTSGTSSLTNIIIIGDCPCTTPPSNAEWATLVGAFPNLVRCHVCIEGGQTLYGASPYPHTGIAYNCLAWTIGDVNRWWWPEADGNGDGTITSAEMTAFYTAKGVAAGTIAYYGPGAGNVAHVAIKTGGRGNDCKATSKLGQSYRISHDLNELEGGSYNNLVGGN